MLHQTKKNVLFIVEIYELDSYWAKNNFIREVFDWDKNSWEKVKTTRYWLTPSCYKKTHAQYFNSVNKLNKALGLKRKKHYWFYNSVEEAIKGAYGDNFHSVINRNEKVLVVRKLHDLESHYTYYHR